MRAYCFLFLLPALGAAQTLKIPPARTSLNLAGQPLAITAWGTVSALPAGVYRVAVTADLEDLQRNITPILRAELNQSERCGERLSVEQATLTPAAPATLLVANVHYERWGCVKAFGKEVVRRVVGGNGVVDVNLTPSVSGNNVALAADVRKVDADGSLGELLRSGSLGDSLRRKLAESIQKAVQKAVDLKSALPPQIESALKLQSVAFSDGGAGKLWAGVTGDVHLSGEELQSVTRQLKP